MKRVFVLALGPVGLLALAACEPVDGAATGAQPGYAVTLPPEVVEMAAPNQDLSTARLRTEDGCFWYTHVGPVETTQLPVRTKGGNPICTRPQS